MGAGTQDPAWAQPERPPGNPGPNSPVSCSDPRGDLPRPRLEMISRSVELLASRMARGSLSVKGNKSLRRHEGSEVKSGEGSVCPISAPPPPNPQPGEEEPGNPASYWNGHTDWKLPWGRRVESGG